MSESIDQLGSAHYLVVEAPARKFDSEIIPELVDLAGRGAVRMLDLVLIKKDPVGSIRVFELDDVESDGFGRPREIDRELVDLLSEDIAEFADALKPGCTAGLLVYENLWAAPLASAVHRSGGHLIANGRIPDQAVPAPGSAVAGPPG
jgi:uncharacterized protein DUF6325